ncbi:MAG: hypothetical protein ACK587_10360 [Cyanobacteriota bacterium]
MSPRRLFLVPLLSPLVAVMLVAALNPAPRVSFQVLTWETPRAPLGLWLATAALGGAALSGGAAGLALRQSAGRAGRRVVSERVRAREPEPWLAEPDERRPSPTEPSEATWRAPVDRGRAAPGRSVAPARAPGDPAPTVVVPFRVLRRPGATAPSAPEREPVAVAAPEDWQDAASEDW